MFSKALIALPMALWAAAAAADVPPKPTETCDTTISVCADYINECGMMYGGCFPDCKPWPTFEPPPCPASSTWATVTTTGPARPECTEEGEHTICVDKVNDCGMKYGGCYDYCATPDPHFVTPACPEPTDGGESIDEMCETAGTVMLCVDGIDDCGNGWGECYDVCATPSLEIPTTPCSTTPVVTVPLPNETNCAEITLCADYINECGMMYGGCHSICSPTPIYTAPPCPTTTEPVVGCPARRH